MTSYELVGYNNSVNLNTISYPLYFYIELTDKCNFNCKFCSVGNKGKNYISFDLLKKFLLELKEKNILDVYYTGGEPLLHPNFKEIIEYGYSLGFRQTVLTNGFFLDKYKDILDKILCVCVSLHGSDSIHNKLVGISCYNKVISNIKMTKKITNVNINCTILNDNQNIDEMINILEFGRKNNIQISFSKYNNIGKGKQNNCSINIKNFSEILDSLYKNGYEFKINDCIPTCLVEEKYEYLTHGCGAGYIFGSLTYNGDIKICPSSSRIIGNIENKSLKKIWYSDQMKKYRKFEWIPIYCKSCKNLSKCRAGCKVELEKNITDFNDYLVTEMIDNIWNNIKNKKAKVNISLIRKDKSSYINLSTPPRKFNKNVLNVINKLNDGCPLIELEDYKDLIVTLYRDKLLEVE